MASLTNTFLTNGPLQGGGGDIPVSSAYKVMWREISHAITDAANKNDEKSSKVIDELKALREHLKHEAERNAGKTIGQIPPDILREFLDVTKAIKQILGVSPSGISPSISPGISPSTVNAPLGNIRQNFTGLGEQAFTGGGPIGTAAVGAADAIAPGMGFVVKAIQENSVVIRSTYHALTGVARGVRSTYQTTASTVKHIHDFLNPNHPLSIHKALAGLAIGTGALGLGALALFGSDKFKEGLKEGLKDLDEKLGEMAKKGREELEQKLKDLITPSMPTKPDGTPVDKPSWPEVFKNPDWWKQGLPQVNPNLLGPDAPGGQVQDLNKRLDQVHPRVTPPTPATPPTTPTTPTPPAPTPSEINERKGRQRDRRKGAPTKSNQKSSLVWPGQYGGLGGIGSMAQAYAEDSNQVRWAEQDVVPFAKGGIVDRPTIGLLGEAGPEMVVPLGGFNTGIGNSGDKGDVVVQLMKKQTDLLGGILEALKGRRTRGLGGGFQLASLTTGAELGGGGVGLGGSGFPGGQGGFPGSGFGAGFPGRGRSGGGAPDSTTPISTTPLGPTYQTLAPPGTSPMGPLSTSAFTQVPGDNFTNLPTIKTIPNPQAAPGSGFQPNPELFAPPTQTQGPFDTSKATTLTTRPNQSPDIDPGMFAGPTNIGGGGPPGTVSTPTVGSSKTTGNKAVDQAIESAAKTAGISPTVMKAIADIESSNNPESNRNNKRTQYKGLFQIGREEWGQFGKGDIYNANDNATAFARMMSHHREQFKTKFGRLPTDTEMYMIHQQGLGFYTKGTMTNITGNPYPGMRGPQTHQSFEAGWGARLERGIQKYTDPGGKSTPAQTVTPAVQPPAGGDAKITEGATRVSQVDNYRNIGGNLGKMRDIQYEAGSFASKFLPEGYKVEAFSGQRREGPHGSGAAIDWRIMGPGPKGPGTEPLGKGSYGGSYQDSPQNFAIYQAFHQDIHKYLTENYPALAQQHRWGGFFLHGTREKPNYGVMDLMHGDFAGGAARMGAGGFERGLSPSAAREQPLFAPVKQTTGGMGDVSKYQYGQGYRSIGLAPGGGAVVAGPGVGPANATPIQRPIGDIIKDLGGGGTGFDPQHIKPRTLEDAKTIHRPGFTRSQSELDAAASARWKTKQANKPTNWPTTTVGGEETYVQRGKPLPPSISKELRDMHRSGWPKYPAEMYDKSWEDEEGHFDWSRYQHEFAIKNKPVMVKDFLEHGGLGGDVVPTTPPTPAFDKHNPSPEMRRELESLHRPFLDDSFTIEGKRSPEVLDLMTKKADPSNVNQLLRGDHMRSDEGGAFLRDRLRAGYKHIIKGGLEKGVDKQLVPTTDEERERGMKETRRKGPIKASSVEGSDTETEVPMPRARPRPGADLGVRGGGPHASDLRHGIDVLKDRMQRPHRKPSTQRGEHRPRNIHYDTPEVSHTNTDVAAHIDATTTYLS